jgi:twinkle protein
MEYVRDAFDLSSYLNRKDDEYRLDSPAKITSSVIDMFYGEKKDEGDFMPWQKTQKLFKFRPGEVTVWCGINGHGKSMITSQVALDLAWNGGKPCIASMEMLPKRTLWRMVRQASGSSEPSIQYIKQFLGWCDRKIHIFDHHGTVNPDLILGAARYAALTLGTKHMFIDSLMKCVKGEDDYNGQKNFIDEACAIARDLNIHLHIIHHVRKGENEFQIPGKFDGKGSGAIADQVDNWITVFRDKRREAGLVANPTDAKLLNAPDCILNIDKQRNGEWEGRIGLFFDPASMSYVEQRGQAPRKYEFELEEVCVPTNEDGTEEQAGQQHRSHGVRPEGGALQAAQG